MLNALNFAWWTNGRLYRFNDPDHVPLYLSVVDGRSATTEEEARSRYYASVISGTVMMLSDNYGPEGDPEVIRMSRERTRMFANNPKINALARLGKAFVPVELSDGTTPFSLSVMRGNTTRRFSISRTASRPSPLRRRVEDFPGRAFSGICEGGDDRDYQGKISVTLKGWDAVIVEVEER